MQLLHQTGIVKKGGFDETLLPILTKSSGAWSVRDLYRNVSFKIFQRIWAPMRENDDLYLSRKSGHGNSINHYRIVPNKHYLILEKVSVNPVTIIKLSYHVRLKSWSCRPVQEMSEVSWYEHHRIRRSWTLH